MSCPVGTANYANTDWKPANLFKGSLHYPAPLLRPDFWEADDYVFFLLRAENVP